MPQHVDKSNDLSQASMNKIEAARRKLKRERGKTEGGFTKAVEATPVAGTN